MLIFLDSFAESCQLLVADGVEIQVIDVRREKEFDHAGVKDPLDLVLVVGHVALIDIVEVRPVGVDDELDAHAAGAGEKFEH